MQFPLTAHRTEYSFFVHLLSVKSQRRPDSPLFRSISRYTSKQQGMITAVFLTANIRFIRLPSNVTRQARFRHLRKALWSNIRELNPHLLLGRQTYCHYTNTAYLLYQHIKGKSFTSSHVTSLFQQDMQVSFSPS